MGNSRCSYVNLHGIRHELYREFIELNFKKCFQILESKLLLILKIFNYIILLLEYFL